MAANFTRLKFVDAETDLLIYGYMNSLSQDPQMTPKEIISLCVLYYFIMEGFSKSSHNLNIESSEDKSGNNNIIKIIKWDENWQSAYGEWIIDGDKYPNAVYEWTFKINLPKMTIGIISGTTDPTELKYCFGRTYSNGFYAINDYGQLEMSHEGDHPGIEDGDYIFTDYIEKGDVLRMIFNVSNKTIAFEKNHGEIKVACKNIDISLKYTMAVALWCDEDNGNIELTDFKCVFA